MFQLKTVLTLVATAALAACTTLGPNYQAPAANAPAAYRSAAPAAGAELQRDWWLMFGDAQLDALEAQALQAGPTLAAAAARIERARAVFGATRADELPRVDVGASETGLRTSAKSVTTPVLGGKAITFEGWQSGLQASLGWEIDLWGRVKRQAEGAQAQLDASTLDAAAARVALTADVAAAYWQWRALADEAKALQRQRDSRAQAFQVAQTRFDAGSSTAQDLERVRAELASADADVADLPRRQALVLNQIAALTGQAAAELKLQATAPLAAPPQIRAGLPSELLQRRPDLAQSLAQLHAATAQVGIAEAAFYPSIHLTGSFGYQSKALGDLVSAPARLYSFGPGISLPLFEGGRNQANLGAAKAQVDESLAGFRGRMLQALREVDDALAELQGRAAVVDAQNRTLASSSQALAVARSRYDKGAVSYLDVTEAERTPLATERALAQLRGAQWAATAQLVKALGGGWAANGG
ncbi:efflux transporter outer membrane subunit [Pelomonas aquatica]|jgi:multidrug efflux system outer membrane protein|uniref:Efflux transporter outer membrane subunit n=1 Tax=Pelomonas aquatica TaxID=431058 RepID=A0A9X4R675_9BURK|nr:efflux transporter outer membrane subunit [Pelomonas aquatica]MCY4756827.1 efflux transporter outer membrane subunit [Pelomonas aquatica]MDG0864461.1 efflux transporter outer membrane subunit [Pelomonas aquatica]